MDDKCKDCKYENKCTCYDCSRLGRKDLFEPKEVEIRPEAAGEYWKNKNGRYAVTLLINDSIWVSVDQGSPMRLPVDFLDIVHNKNGWTRPYPPVEDEKVERIEVEGVVCKEEEECVYTVETTFTAPKDLSNKPMKMILEMSKPW